MLQGRADDNRGSSPLASVPSPEDAGTQVPVQWRTGTRYHLEPSESQYRAGFDTACGRRRVPVWRTVARADQVPAADLCGPCSRLLARGPDAR
jgi:hypothetical protein